MSGHSHWASIKHKKGAEDEKRGKIFSKLTRQILIAAKQGGSDPVTNQALRMAVEKAKEFNMPKDNIERAVKKGSGELEGEKLEEVIFEAYGPGNIAIIIEGITDNRNRALGEIKKILTQYGGKLVGEGAIRWMFERKGAIALNLNTQIDNLKDKEQMELLVIESGAEDIYWHDNVLYVYTRTEDLEKVKKILEEKQAKIQSSSLDWVAKEMLTLDEKQKEQTEELFEALDESDTVQEIYSNLKM
jgi:YebC/PmpR family DNA-binding regulatory protein